MRFLYVLRRLCSMDRAVDLNRSVTYDKKYTAVQVDAHCGSYCDEPQCKYQHTAVQFLRN